MKSIAFREQVLTYWSEGHTVSATAKKFGIYKTTVYEWEKRLKTNGNLEPTHRVYLRKPKRKHSDKIPPEELKKYVAENPYARQWEIAQHFKCSRTVVYFALRRENIKYYKPPCKIPPEELKTYVSENPNAFQSEIAAHFGCNQSAVSLAIKRGMIKWERRRKKRP